MFFPAMSAVTAVRHFFVASCFVDLVLFFAPRAGDGLGPEVFEIAIEDVEDECG